MHVVIISCNTFFFQKLAGADKIETHDWISSNARSTSSVHRYCFIANNTYLYFSTLIMNNLYKSKPFVFIPLGKLYTQNSRFLSLIGIMSRRRNTLSVETCLFSNIFVLIIEYIHS